MKITTPIIVLLVLFCLLAHNTNGDTVILVNGSRIEGAVLKNEPAKVVIDIGPSVITIPGSEVEKVIRKAKADSEDDKVTLPALIEGVSEPSLKIANVKDLVRKVGQGVVKVSNNHGHGAGFFITDVGHVITNYHVIEGEEKNTVTVFLKKDKTVKRVDCKEVKIIAINRWMDLALLQIKKDDLAKLGKKSPRLQIGSTRRLEAGSKVVAIGNPGILDTSGAKIRDIHMVTLTHTTSEGIVSSPGRSLKGLVFIQTTAAINPGNSGGPLFDENGRVVGVVTLGTHQSNIGFALKAEYMKAFIKDYEAFAVSESNPNEAYRYPDAPKRSKAKAEVQPKKKESENAKGR